VSNRPEKVEHDTGKIKLKKKKINSKSVTGYVVFDKLQWFIVSLSNNNFWFILSLNFISCVVVTTVN
jgi:hypothetical protein